MMRRASTLAAAALLAACAGHRQYPIVRTGQPLDALDARTGEILWHIQTGSGIHASPITYSVNGKQYVAIASGWGGWMKGFAPELYGGTRGSALLVFALP